MGLINIMKPLQPLQGYKSTIATSTLFSTEIKSGTRGSEPRAAGFKSKQVSHCAMMYPIIQHANYLQSSHKRSTLDWIKQFEADVCNSDSEFEWIEAIFKFRASSGRSWSSLASSTGPDPINKIQRKILLYAGIRPITSVKWLILVSPIG